MLKGWFVKTVWFDIVKLTVGFGVGVGINVGVAKLGMVDCGGIVGVCCIIGFGVGLLFLRELIMFCAYCSWCQAQYNPMAK